MTAAGTVELLPVHENVPGTCLVGRGLTNYQGYNTIGYFGIRPRRRTVQFTEVSDREMARVGRQDTARPG